MLLFNLVLKLSPNTFWKIEFWCEEIKKLNVCKKKKKMLLEPAAKVPVSRGNSSPRSPSTDSDIVLFVYVLQKLYVDSLVPLLCISKVSKILNEKNIIIIIKKKRITILT